MRNFASQRAVFVPPPQLGRLVCTSFIGLLAGILLLIGFYAALKFNESHLDVTLFSLGLNTSCQQKVCSISVSSNAGIRGNSKNDLYRIMDMIHALSWNWKVPLGPVEFYSFFGHDGYDGFGVSVIGPYFGVRFSAPVTRNYSDYREFIRIQNLYR